MVVFNFQKKKKLAKKNISSNCSAVTSTTNRSNKNMLPLPKKTVMSLEVEIPL